MNAHGNRKKYAPEIKKKIHNKNAECVQRVGCVGTTLRETFIFVGTYNRRIMLILMVGANANPDDPSSEKFYGRSLAAHRVINVQRVNKKVASNAF